MNLFKIKIEYPNFLKILFKGNIEWYNTILENDDGFPKHIYDQISLTYLNISIAMHFFINEITWSNNIFPTNYKNVDINEVFTKSLFLSFLDYGYDESQAQDLLNKFNKFINIVFDYRNRFDEDTLKIKNSYAHILKSCAAKQIIDMLIDEGVVDKDNFVEMNSSVCKFINTIMIDNRDTFNKLLKKCRFI